MLFTLKPIEIIFHAELFQIFLKHHYQLHSRSIEYVRSSCPYVASLDNGGKYPRRNKTLKTKDKSQRRAIYELPLPETDFDTMCYLLG